MWCLMPPAHGRQKFTRTGGTRMPARTVAMLQLSGQSMFLHYRLRDNGFPSLYIAIHPKAAVINLAKMTHPEFVAFRDFMNLAMDLGEIITETLDAEASYNFEEGQRDFYRLYRQLPILALRRGLFPQHFEKLQERPFPVPNLDGEVRPDPIGLAGNRASRTVMAPIVRRKVATAHLAAEAHGTAELGEMGRQPELPGELPGTEAGPSGTAPDS